ncbi:MAG: hypothetical protein QOE97_3214 [Pseudonocardiales bacterium]|nr:hypothetical protein [Pseudonocardiales bacterium]
MHPSIGQFRVRRLAAVDLQAVGHGTRRKSLTITQYAAGAVFGLGLGLFYLIGGSLWLRVLGAILLGMGLNFAALTVNAVDLCRRGRLDDELNGAAMRDERHYYAINQFWIAVPGLLAVLALRPRDHNRLHV